MKKKGLLFLLVLVIAIFFRFYWFDSITPDYATATIGVLTVIGLYLLVQKILNWQIAFLSSFLLASSFVHVLYSRIPSEHIFMPLFFVWASYFLWRGLSEHHTFDFIMAGALWGLGFYTVNFFFITPVIVLITFLIYFGFLKAHYHHEKYAHLRNQFLSRIGLFIVVGFLIALPVLWRVYNMPSDFWYIASEPQTPTTDTTVLILPVLILFIIGFLKNLIRIGKHYQQHKHLPTVHIFLLTWFFIGLIPYMLWYRGLAGLSANLLIVVVACIFAGEALWSFYEFITKWYHARHPHFIHLTRHGLAREGALIASLTLAIFLAAITATEYVHYKRDGIAIELREQ